MTRGPYVGYQNGQRIAGRYFFGGTQEGLWSWGQASGVNAGVMLLELHLTTLAQEGKEKPRSGVCKTSQKLNCLTVT